MWVSHWLKEVNQYKYTNQNIGISFCCTIVYLKKVTLFRLDKYLLLKLINSRSYFYIVATGSQQLGDVSHLQQLLPRQRGASQSQEAFTRPRNAAQDDQVQVLLQRAARSWHVLSSRQHRSLGMVPKTFERIFWTREPTSLTNFSIV